MSMKHDNKPTEEMRQEFEAWLADRPAIADVARRYPPWTCYRGADNPLMHYVLYSYSETPRGVEVSAVHGHDSTLPGHRVFGLAPETLRICACGNWRE